MTLVSSDIQAQALALDLSLKILPISSGCELTLSHLFYITFKDYREKNAAAHKLIDNTNNLVKVFGPTLEDLKDFGYDGLCKTNDFFASVIKQFNATGQEIPDFYIRNRISQIINQVFSHKDYFINSNSDGYYLDSTKFISFAHLNNQTGLLTEFAVQLNNVRNVFIEFIGSKEFKNEIDALLSNGSKEPAPTSSARHYPAVKILKNRDELAAIDVGDIFSSDFSENKEYGITLHEKHLCLYDRSKKEKQFTLCFKEDCYPISVKVSPKGEHFFCVDAQKRLLIWKFGKPGEDPILLNVIPLHCDKMPILMSNKDNLIVWWTVDECEYISMWPFEKFNSIYGNSNIIDAIAPAFSTIIPFKLGKLIFSSRLAISTHSFNKLVGKDKAYGVITFWRLPEFEKIEIELYFDQAISSIELSPSEDKLLIVQNDGQISILDILQYMHYKSTSIRKFRLEILFGVQSYEDKKILLSTYLRQQGKLVDLFQSLNSVLFFDNNSIAYINHENHLCIWNLERKENIKDFKNESINSGTKLLHSGNVHQILVQNSDRVLYFDLNDFQSANKVICSSILTAKISRNLPPLITILDEEGNISDLDPTHLHVHYKDSIVSFWTQLKCFKEERVDYEFELFRKGTIMACFVKEAGYMQGIRKLFLYSTDEKITFFDQGSIKFDSVNCMRGAALSDDANFAFIITNFHFKKISTHNGKIVDEFLHNLQIPGTAKLDLICKGLNPKFLAFSFDSTLYFLDVANKRIHQKKVFPSKFRSIALNSEATFLAIKDVFEDVITNDQKYSKIPGKLRVFNTDTFLPIKLRDYDAIDCTNFHFYDGNKLEIDSPSGKSLWVLNEISATRFNPEEAILSNMQTFQMFESVSVEGTTLKLNGFNESGFIETPIDLTKLIMVN